MLWSLVPLPRGLCFGRCGGLPVCGLVRVRLGLEWGLRGAAGSSGTWPPETFGLCLWWGVVLWGILVDLITVGCGCPVLSGRVVGSGRTGAWGPGSGTGAPPCVRLGQVRGL